MKPIKTENDYERAIRDLRQLLESNEAGSNSDKIEVLTALIERYERNAIQIEAPTPIAAIKFRMEQGGLTPRDLEPYIGSRGRVSEVLSGKRDLSLDMIRALHEGLGIPYESLMQRADVEEEARFEVSKPVLNKLTQLGFRLNSRNINDFIKSMIGLNFKPALARRTRTQRSSAKTDSVALLVWQAAVLAKASQCTALSKYDPKKLNIKLFRRIAHLSVERDGPRKAIELLNSFGVIVVLLPTLPGTFLDGAAMLSKEGEPIIALTIRHDRIDNFWFTLLHELAHIVCHFDVISSGHDAFFDDLDLASEDKREQEADELAQDALIPQAAFAEANWNTYSSIEDINSISESAGVHVSVVAGRWQRDHADYRKFSRLIERNTLRTMFRLQ